MENKENVLFVGSSGVGKTHLAISLGIAAAKKILNIFHIMPWFNNAIKESS